MTPRRRTRPFRKVLIANRGEIACRIIRTCRRMRIKTVAVFSEADRGALHAETADEAVAIGPAPASQSYLCSASILEAARATKADAVHPGYGFLSENAAFARAVDEAGLTFVGPPADAIEIMGDKLAAKELAAKAGVNVVPGNSRPAATALEAAVMADGIGYPVMLKAAAGGGGKGMRIAGSNADVRELFPLASGEAKSSFGDARVFVERYFPSPRHIEVQVLADAHGQCISLGERECSIQRRHQKIFEEAPAPRFEPEVRRRMEQQAVALAKAVGYRSAGTVEFIVDSEGEFHFLEMNTRLQVEHPVTEQVTGVDLVEEMLRVAAGEPLRLRQQDIPRNAGWAIEARVYAEDAERGFVPSVGRIRRLTTPPTRAGNGVRIDTGVVEGSEITPHYDPMIAKVITYGKDRQTAVRSMQAALDGFYIRGPRTNVTFLAGVARTERFEQGELDTGFLDTEYPDGYQPPLPEGETRDALIAAAAFVQRVEEARAGPPAERQAWQAVVMLGEETVPCTVRAADGGCDVEIGDRQLAVRSTWRPGQVVFHGRVNARSVVIQIDPAVEGWTFTHAGVTTRTLVRTPEIAALAVHMPKKAMPDHSNRLCSPMPGLVISIAVAEGDEVRAGQVIAVVEAMKAENQLRAERDGVIRKIGVKAGDNIAAEEVIAEFA